MNMFLEEATKYVAECIARIVAQCKPIEPGAKTVDVVLTDSIELHQDALSLPAMHEFAWNFAGTCRYIARLDFGIPEIGPQFRECLRESGIVKVRGREQWKPDHYVYTFTVILRAQL